MKLIINNENKKLSGNRRRRIERIFEVDNKMKPLLNKTKSEKKKKNKNIDKLKELEIEVVIFKYDNNPNKLQSELKK